MRIGLIGSGGREHAIAKALCKNSKRDSLFVYGNHINPGIQRIAKSCRAGDVRDSEQIIAFFSANDVELVVNGPEVPLIAGVSNRLRDAGYKVVGPTQAQARLEGDKVFMRDLLRRRVKKGSPRWMEVSDVDQARAFIDEIGEVAIKPIGLTGGKGVWVMGVHFTSMGDVMEKVASQLEQDGVLLLEERLIGEEFSRMAFVSGSTAAPMPVAQDFKYAYDGDKGGMTGGMGSYTMADGSMPFLTESNLSEADEILQLTVNAIEEETGEDYRGFLYGQFMATANGVRVIEFNVRLGDPEAINVMALLDMDVPFFFEEIADGVMKNKTISFMPKASLSKYLVPAAYPGQSKAHVEIAIDESEVEEAGFSVIYASVSENNGKIKTLGSRALAIVGLGDDTAQISAEMEALLAKIEPSSLRHRRDIGDERIIQSKIEHMNHLRGEVS